MLDKNGRSKNSNFVKNLKELLIQHGSSIPDQMAIKTPGADLLTYRQLNILREEIALTLKNAGLTEKHRVGLIIKNRPMMASLLLYLGSHSIVPPINAHQNQSKL